MLRAVARYYDKVAPRYRDRYLGMRYYRILYRKVGEALDRYMRPGMKVLDVGAGTGFWSLYLAGKGLQVYSLDISQESIRLCPCGHRLVADAEALPTRPHSFDAVVALGSVYNYLEDLGYAFAQVAWTLRRGGLFIADIDNAVCLDMAYEYLLFQGLHGLTRALARGWVKGTWESADGEMPFNYHSYFRVRGALQAAGMRLVEARPIYLLPPLPTRLLQRRMRGAFLEKLDLLKPLAPLATTVLYVAKRL